MDSAPDPDLDIFVGDHLQDANKKLFLLLPFKGKFTLIFRDKKVIKKSQNRRNRGFSYYFCLMIEGSGSGNSKNIRILQIRIRNTVYGKREEQRRMETFSFEISVKRKNRGCETNADKIESFQNDTIYVCGISSNF